MIIDLMKSIVERLKEVRDAISQSAPSGVEQPTSTISADGTDLSVDTGNTTVEYLVEGDLGKKATHLTVMSSGGKLTVSIDTGDGQGYRTLALLNGSRVLTIDGVYVSNLKFDLDTSIAGNFSTVSYIAW